MRKMTDRSRNEIVPLRIEDQRNGAHGAYKVFEIINFFRVTFFGGRQNIICVFQKQGPGIDIACTLAACHGMPADKLRLQSGCGNFFVNSGFYAPYIGQDTGGRYTLFNLRQVSVITADRCAQKQKVTAGKTAVDPVRSQIDNVLFPCKPQSGRVGIIRNKEYVFTVLFPQSVGNGAADQSKTDKTASEFVHS